MKDIKEPTTQLRPWPHVSSDWGHASLELGISTPPPQAEESLPERYGIPLFEVLIVDPEYLFLSWEVTDNQLQLARELFGNKGYQTRRLIAVMENEHGSVLAEYELYGELGRWFVRHVSFGESVRLKLRFIAQGQKLELYESGLLQLPRIHLAEPEYYQELEVIYGIGSKGQLVLKGFMQDKTAPWPSVRLELPEGLLPVSAGEQALDAFRSLGPHGGSPTSGWLPSSPGIWPSSPSSGKQFASGEPIPQPKPEPVEDDDAGTGGVK